MRVPRDTIASLTSDGDLVPGTVQGAVPVWPFTQSRRFPWRSRNPKWLDPVNLLVIGIAPHAVMAMLAQRGWTRPDDGATHRTWISGRFVRMSDHTALGDRSERVHARLFPVGAGTLLAVHHEVADDRGHHQVTSWDRAREATVDALESAGAIRMVPSDPVTPRNVRGAPGDGRVHRLRAG